ERRAGNSPSRGEVVQPSEGSAGALEGHHLRLRIHRHRRLRRHGNRKRPGASIMMTNYGKRVTQGQFSFLPDLTDAQITAQIEYALENDWAVNIEYTDDPHPRNTY